MKVRLRTVAGNLLLALLAPLVFLALLEGSASLLLFFRDASFRRTMAETRHSRYDADLGWVAEAGVALPGMYGPGKDLHTNNRGFRGRAETAEAVPAGHRRVICSGDSFTLGYGVADEATWYALLGAAPGLEAVNMGQGGYGFDQAYLWYRRDGAPLAHDVQIFAYITDDFRRMRKPRFLGYGKPMLAVHADTLAVTNVPPPGYSRLAAWTLGNQDALRRVRLFQLFARMARTARQHADSLRTDSAVAQAATAVIRDLARLHGARGSRLIMVHLPVRQDHSTEISRAWRTRISDVAVREGVMFVDLVDAFRRLPADSVAPLFMGWDALDYAGAAGHYNEQGNRWVAAQLRPFLNLALLPR